MALNNSREKYSNLRAGANDGRIKIPRVDDSAEHTKEGVQSENTDVKSAQGKRILGRKRGSGMKNNVVNRRSGTRERDLRKSPPLPEKSFAGFWVTL